MYSQPVVTGPMPKAVGRYQIVDRLAVGGMAELFKATLTGEHGFAKLVAIKKILPHLATDHSFVEMFIDEARITAQLDHKHIVAVFELGTDADTPYIAMQYVDGLDVLALLRECARAQIRLSPDLAALIAREVLDALDYAHNALDVKGKPLGIVHRDISPGNVLLSWRGDVKLTDFGIARAAERRHKTEAGTLKGKYGYMSPEQVSGAEVDARSDLFSVGILLAEMVMARRHQAQAELEAQQARAEFMGNSGVPEPAVPDPTLDMGSSGTMTISDDDVMPEQPKEQASGPREVGDLREQSVLRVVYKLARTKGTGLLTLEGRAGVLKEAYFLEGQPQFVNSNVESERLGQFLLEQKALSPQALQRALSVMHHFGGRL